MLSSYIKLHDFRVIPPAVHRLWCTTYPYPFAKALCCVVRSHYGRHMQSYISYTRGLQHLWFLQYSCSHLPRSPSCSISTCDLPSVNIKGNGSDPWTGNFLLLLFSLIPAQGFSPETSDIKAFRENNSFKELLLSVLFIKVNIQPLPLQILVIHRLYVSSATQ